MAEWGRQKTGFTRTKEGNELDQAIERVRNFYKRPLEDSEITKITENLKSHPHASPTELMSTYGGKKRKSRKQKKSLKRKSRKQKKSLKKRR